MTGTIRHFYAGGNTARGFTSLLTYSLQELERVIVLQGGPGIGKLINIREIGNRLAEQGHEIWIIHCASYPEAVDSVIIPRLKLGIVDGTAPHDIASDLSGEKIQYVNINEVCSAGSLESQKSEIDRLNNEISAAYERAYSGFAEALRIHDDWERIYIANMDFQKANLLTAEYTGLLYGVRKLEKRSKVEHRFLGAATPRGAIDFVPNLSEGLKRYLIKGRPGSGKSTMLKNLAAAAVDRGLDVEIYHCGFDPNSLDMIIVREAGFAIFDSTAPHEYAPDRPTDEIVDMYSLCIRPGTDEAYAETIRQVKELYAAKMKQSIEHLAHAKSLLDPLERIYILSVDLPKIERIKDELIQDIASVEAV